MSTTLLNTFLPLYDINKKFLNYFTEINFYQFTGVFSWDTAQKHAVAAESRKENLSPHSDEEGARVKAA